MQEQPRALRQRNRDIVSGSVGFLMFVGLAMFAWRVGSPPDQTTPPAAQPSDTSTGEQTAPDERPGSAQDTATSDAGASDESGATGNGSEPPSDPIQQVRDLLDADAPVTTVVLGDSTGDTSQKWVHTWARSLAEERPVSITHWDAGPDPGYYPVVDLSASGSSPLMIWNGSVAGATPSAAQDRLTEFLPDRTDVVLLNFGRATTIEDFPEQMGALVEELRARFGEIPVLMTLQNPPDADADAAIREAGERWAEQAGVGVLDVAGEFPDVDNALPSDATSTSPDGQQRWAEVVTDALE